MEAVRGHCGASERCERWVMHSNLVLSNLTYPKVSVVGFVAFVL